MSARAGKFRTRVTVQQAVETRDSVGGVDVAWEDVSDRWAHVAPLSGREMIESEQVRAGATHMVHVRFPGLTLTAKMRFVVKGTTRILYPVAALNTDEMGETYRGSCQERFDGVA